MQQNVNQFRYLIDVTRFYRIKNVSCDICDIDCVCSKTVVWNEKLLFFLFFLLQMNPLLAYIPSDVKR